MIGWHHRLNGHEFEQTLGDSNGQGSLECCSPQGHKKSDTTDSMNDNKGGYVSQPERSSLTKAASWVTQQITLLCLPELYLLRVPPTGIAHAPLLWPG